MSKRINWSGVFPAVTTQFNDDFSINLEKTHQVISNVIRDGVSGLVVCGSVGENTSLTAEEKIAVTEVAVDASRGRVPVICGVAEFTSIAAAKVANAVRRVGVDGVMLMPALVYGSKPFETAEHYRYVAKNADVPLMVYNNPPIYKNDVTPDILISLADCDNVVCFKDSSGDTRRFIDVRNEVGDRFVLFAGLDDVVLESIAVGAEGWVSGMSNVFPKEGETIFRLAKAGRFAEAMPIYEWLMPILHLDARADLVQCIKLCEAIAGRGSALTRPPRLALPEADRVFVEQIMAKALANRPELPDVGLRVIAGRVLGVPARLPVFAPLQETPACPILTALPAQLHLRDSSVSWPPPWPAPSPNGMNSSSTAPPRHWFSASCFFARPTARSTASSPPSPCMPSASSPAHWVVWCSVTTVTNSAVNACCN